MSKLTLDSVEWREFRIKDIFQTFIGNNGLQVHTGGYIKKSKFIESNIPRITVKETNNGIDDYVYSTDKNFRVFENFISVSFLGGVFYHPYKASIDMKVHALVIENIQLNKYIAQFLINSIKNNIKYSSYGNQLSSTDLPRVKIILPILSEGNPNWQFMEDYIKQKMKEQSQKIVNYYENKLFKLSFELLDLEVEWKEFKIKDIFSIKSVKGKTITTYKNGKIPYISTSSNNNGLSNFIDTKENISNKNCISIDPIGGKAFFHEYDFVGRGGAGSAINLLYNENLDKYSALFVCKIIENNAINKASYGIQLNGNRLKNLKIILPIDKSGNPHWEYMSKFIKKLEVDSIKNVVQYIYIQIKEKLKKCELSNIEWKDFFFTDIFKEIKRGKRLTKANQEEGNVPYVSSTASDNGIDNFISNDKGVRKYKNNLSVANSGSVGSCFYHKYEYIASDHITALTCENVNENIYKFMATIIKRLEKKYSFNREINDTRISREKIFLPSNVDGSPNYDFMKKYIIIKEIEEIKKILDKYNLE